MIGLVSRLTNWVLVCHVFWKDVNLNSDLSIGDDLSIFLGLHWKPDLAWIGGIKLQFHVRIGR